ncbi:MAG: TSUP family transporter [Bacteriovoracaceae bacterium]
MIVELILIFILSFVQSILGVGLLVFGTPTMILLGHSFEHTLSILLPSSVIISFLQLYQSWFLIEKQKRAISIFSLPFLIIGLVVVLNNESRPDLKLTLAFVLIISGLLRMIPSWSKWIDQSMKKIERPYLMVLGIVHGLSNLGGGLLTLYAASKANDKVQVRGIISFGYLIFGVVQLLILFILKHSVFHYKMLIYPVLSGLIFYFLGNAVFKKLPEKLFSRLVTLLIFCYGIILALN